MTRVIPVNIPSLTRSVEVTVSEHATAGQVIQQCLRQLDIETTGYGTDDAAWILRVHPRAEAGKWWTEEEIREYRSRE